MSMRLQIVGQSVGLDDEVDLERQIAMVLTLIEQSCLVFTGEDGHGIMTSLDVSQPKR